MISVIIPFSGNKIDLLDRQLLALGKQQVSQKVEIIIVCNMAELNQEFLDAYTKNGPFDYYLVHAAEQSGASYARNCGVAASNGELLLFCDADDIVHQGWAEELSKGLETFDLVGGVLKSFVDGEKNRALSQRIPRLPTKFNFLPFASSSNLGVRREVFLKLEGFSTNYFGAEDTEFCWRAQSRYFTLGFIDTAIIDYRLRNNFKAAFIQHFAYGKSDHLLMLEWNLRKESTFPWKYLSKSILILSMPFFLFNPKYRRVLGTCLGYLTGFTKPRFNKFGL